MFAVSTYEEVIDHERFVENQEIVVLLFVEANESGRYGYCSRIRIYPL